MRPWSSRVCIGVGVENHRQFACPGLVFRSSASNGFNFHSTPAPCHLQGGKKRSRSNDVLRGTACVWMYLECNNYLHATTVGTHSVFASRSFSLISIARGFFSLFSLKFLYSACEKHSGEAPPSGERGKLSCM